MDEVEVQDFNDDDVITNSISNLLNDDLSTNQEPVQETVTETVQEPVSEPEPSIPDDYKVKVKVNGIETEVPLSELRNGYQRQADYTTKTQELAQQREEVKNQAAEYQQYLNSIPMLAQVAVQNINDAQNKLYSQEFVELATSDPALYISEKAKLEKIINQNSQAAHQMQQQYEQSQNQYRAAQEQEFNQRLAQANEILSREIDGWSDGTVIDSLRDYATSKIGFQANELDGLIDPRQVQVLNKARLYDELMAQQNVATKKVQAVPSRTLKPGVATTTADQDEFKAQMRKVTSSGNDRDIAALMANLL